MVDISKILKTIISKSGMEQEKFGESIDVKKAAFNNYVQGRRELPKSVITRMMEVHNINPAVFFDEDAPLYIRDMTDKTAPTNVIPLQQNIVQIPIIGKIACGDPITAEQNIEGYTYEFADFLPKGEIFALIAKGDSMEPTIANGSKVLVRAQSDVENGELAAVLVNGDEEATLKRVKKQGNTILLMPDNPAHEPIVVTESNPARIIGKIVRAIMDFD